MINSNFTGQMFTGTDTLTSSDTIADLIDFIDSFPEDGKIVVSIVDSAGVIYVDSLVEWDASAETLTRHDIWTWNGTVVDNNPSSNIALTGAGGKHTVRVGAMQSISGGEPPIKTWLDTANEFDYGDNWDLSSISHNTMDTDEVSYTPLLLNRPRIITNLATHINVADAGATVSKMGLYSTTWDGKPGTRLEQVDLDVTSGGNKVVALSSPRVLKPGWYYTAIATDGTGVKVPRMNLNGILNSQHGYRISTPRHYMPYETLAGAWTDLPATATAAIGENYCKPVFWN